MPIHHLIDVDPETLTAICSVCGQTEIRKRRIGEKYPIYICATQKLEYALKYRRAHNIPPRKKPKHGLSQIDEENKTAVCSKCGLVKIYVYKYEMEGRYKVKRRCSGVKIEFRKVS